MRVIGDYDRDGYAHVEGLVTPEVTQALLRQLKADIGAGAIRLSGVRDFPNLLERPAFELYGHLYPPLLAFLWGLTPTICRLTGRDLLPTYDYLRIYREGDVCKVHSDRYACEHSLSLTLDYSDGEPWPLEVERAATEPSARVEPDFGGSAHGSVAMAVGDGVLYRGVHHRHGRTTPNPNAWSAHLFLHWVERGGPHEDQAFDGRMQSEKVNFSFA